MTLLVTGGNGFVMSHLVRHWLASHLAERAIVLDNAPADPAVRDFLAPVADRIVALTGDIADPSGWEGSLPVAELTHVVHGAAVTPHPYIDADGTARHPERENPRHVLRVNIDGTAEILDIARRLPNLRRFLYVSTGSVYSDDGPSKPGQPLPEDGYVAPKALYSVSKYASELIVRRYGQLYDMSCVAARLSAVYGPMDRVTGSRNVRCLPNLVANLAVAGETLKVSGMDAVGDWIHADDVATGLAALLRPAMLRHPVYNIAYGKAETVETIIAHVSERIPVCVEMVTAAEANVVCDPDRRAGQWGAYDVSRLHDELGWSPAPLKERVQGYVDWLLSTRTVPERIIPTPTARRKRSDERQ